MEKQQKAEPTRFQFTVDWTKIEPGFVKMLVSVRAKDSVAAAALALEEGAVYDGTALLNAKASRGDVSM